MGLKQIWDGEDLPPVGCEVLCHLGSCDAWVPHVVVGYGTRQWAENPCLFRVDINVGPSKDPRSSKNQRSLHDIRPLDWRNRHA